MSDGIAVGISSCLLGNAVRYNGAHCRDAYINDELSQYFEFHAFCPEIEIGMGVPRPPIRLVASAASVRVLGAENPELDVTARLSAYGRAQYRRVSQLHGFILKKSSPSCGTRVNIYDSSGRQVRQGPGAFAKAVMEAFPNLPIVEEGDLGDLEVRESFVESVFAHHSWQRLMAVTPNAVGVKAFHTRIKPRLERQDPVRAKELSEFILTMRDGDMARASSIYFSPAMAVLTRPLARRRCGYPDTF